MKKVLFITRNEKTLQEVEQVIQGLLGNGYDYFICQLKNQTDAFIIQTLTQYRMVYIELVCSDSDMKLSPKLTRNIYNNCQGFCYIDHFGGDVGEQLKYLVNKADKICKI